MVRYRAVPRTHATHVPRSEGLRPIRNKHVCKVLLVMMHTDSIKINPIKMGEINCRKCRHCGGSVGQPHMNGIGTLERYNL